MYNDNSRTNSPSSLEEFKMDLLTDEFDNVNQKPALDLHTS